MKKTKKYKTILILAVLALIVILIITLWRAKSLNAKESNNNDICDEVIKRDSLSDEEKEQVKTYISEVVNDPENGLSAIISEKKLRELCDMVLVELTDSEVNLNGNDGIISYIDDTLNKKIKEIVIEEVSDEMMTYFTDYKKSEINTISNQVKNKIINELDGYATQKEVKSMIEEAIKSNSNSNKQIQQIINNSIRDSAYVEYIEKVIKGTKGEKGEKGDPGKTPQKGVDYFTLNDINEIACRTSEVVSENYMTSIVSGVVEQLMIDGNITLSTYQKDVIDTIVERLMKETTSADYIKETVLCEVQTMITESIASTYQDGKIYNKGDMVAFNSNIYICLLDGTTNSPDDINVWEKTTLNDIINQLNRSVYELSLSMQESTKDTVNGFLSSIAPLYISGKSYNNNDIVTDGNNLYISLINSNNYDLSDENSWEKTSIKDITDMMLKEMGNLENKVDLVEYAFIPDGNGSGTVKIVYKAN